MTWKEGRLADSSPRRRQNRQDTSFLGYNIHSCAKKMFAMYIFFTIYGPIRHAGASGIAKMSSDGLIHASIAIIFTNNPQTAYTATINEQAVAKAALRDCFRHPGIQTKLAAAVTASNLPPGNAMPKRRHGKQGPPATQWNIQCKYCGRSHPAKSCPA